MENKEKFISAAIIGIALIVSGFTLRNGIVTFKSMDRKVTVKGLQADYKYVRRPDGGFVNTATRRVIYTPDRRIVSAD